MSTEYLGSLGNVQWRASFSLGLSTMDEHPVMEMYIRAVEKEYADVVGVSIGSWSWNWDLQSVNVCCMKI